MYVVTSVHIDVSFSVLTIARSRFTSNMTKTHTALLLCDMGLVKRDSGGEYVGIPSRRNSTVPSKQQHHNKTGKKDVDA